MTTIDAHPGDDRPAGASPEAPPLPPRYTARALVGRGGMGEVWRVHDAVLDREVALKVLRRGLERSASLRREGRLTAGLAHPGVVPVHDLGALPDGRPFYTMRLVLGRTLEDEIHALHRASPPTDWARTHRGLDLVRLVEVCRQAAETVGYAHGTGLVHRDLTPANVRLTDADEVVVLDWGLVSAADRADPEGPGPGAGTPGFVAPELLQPGAVISRPAVDVYALGAVLFQVLVGHAPASPEDAVDLRPARPVPAALLAVVRAAMARDAAARPRDGAALVKVLDDALNVLRSERDARRAIERAEQGWARLDVALLARAREGLLRLLDARALPVERPAAALDADVRTALADAGLIVEREGGDVGWRDPRVPRVWPRLLDKAGAPSGPARTLRVRLSADAIAWAREPTLKPWHDARLRAAERALPAWSLLPAVERRFLRAGVALRRRRRLRAVALGCVLLVVVGAWIGRAERARRLEAERAQAAERHAAARQLISRATLAGLEGDAHRALALLRAAHALEPTADVRARVGRLAASLGPMRALPPHERHVWWADWSPDDGLLATASADGTVRIVDVTSAAEKARIAVGSAAYWIEWAPDGRALALGTEAGRVAIWPRDGGALRDLVTTGAAIQAVGWSPDGRHLAATDQGGRLRVWSRDGTPSMTWRGQQAAMNVRWVGPRAVATGTRDGTVVALDVGAASPRWRRSLGAPVRWISSTPAGAHLIVLTDDRRLHVLGAEDGRVNAAWILGAVRGESVAASPNGQRLATVDRDGAGAVWTLSGDRVARLEGGHGRGRAVDWSRDGRFVVTVGVDGRAAVWDPASGVELESLSGLAGGARNVWPGPAGWLAVSDDTGQVRVWRPRVSAAQPVRCAGSGGPRVHRAPDGRRALLVAPHGGATCVVDLETGAERALAPPAHRAVWSSGGRVLAVSADRRRVRVGAAVHRLPPALQVPDLQPLDVQGQHVVLAPDRSTLAWWRPGDAEVRTLALGRGRRAGLAHRRDGRLPVLSPGPALQAVDLSTGALRPATPWRTEVAVGVGVSARWLLAGRHDGRVAALDLRRPTAPAVAVGRLTEKVFPVALDPTGARVAIADRDARLQVVRLPDGEIEADLLLDARGVQQLVWLDARRLAWSSVSDARVQVVRPTAAETLVALPPGGPADRIVGGADHLLVVRRGLPLRWPVPTRAPAPHSRSNLRVCPDSMAVVAVPSPSAAPRAPAHACAAAGAGRVRARD